MRAALALVGDVNYGSAELKEFLGETSIGGIPAEFLTTDRIMQRWAQANGSGLPTDRWDDSRQSRPDPLDDHSALIMDRIVLTCPPTTRRIVEAWYRTPLPTRTIAKQLGMSKRALEKAHLLSLNFLKWKIECSNHLTLLKLLKIRA